MLFRYVDEFQSNPEQLLQVDSLAMFQHFVHITLPNQTFTWLITQERQVCMIMFTFAVDHESIRGFWLQFTTYVFTPFPFTNTHAPQTHYLVYKGKLVFAHISSYLADGEWDPTFVRLLTRLIHHLRWLSSHSKIARRL